MAHRRYTVGKSSAWIDPVRVELTLTAIRWCCMHMSERQFREAVIHKFKSTELEWTTIELSGLSGVKNFLYVNPFLQLGGLVHKLL